MAGSHQKNSAVRGRPRKNEITKLKVMTWFGAVAMASGKTAAELEREFAGQGQVRRIKGREIRPKLWEKYRRGAVEPRMVPSKGKSVSIVQQVEQAYPGTSKWLTLPLWLVLDSEQRTMGELHNVLRGLEMRVRHLLLFPEAPHDGPFWEMSCRDAERLVETLYDFNSLDATTALAVLIRQAEICQDQLLHEEAYWALITSVEALECDPPLKAILPQLRLYLIRKFTGTPYTSDGKSWHRPFVDPNHRGMYQAMLDERRGRGQLELFEGTFNRP